MKYGEVCIVNLKKNEGKNKPFILFFFAFITIIITIFQKWGDIITITQEAKKVSNRPRIAKIGNKFYDLGTTNKSFLKVANQLKILGIRNCYFMLEIRDISLINVNPHSVDKEGHTTLSRDQVSRVTTECSRNPWYFLRECVRVLAQGGSTVPYRANRGNIAQAWCMLHGIDSWLCLPRQQGKTISSLCLQAWAYLFGTTNSTFIFVNKDGDNAKENLNRIRDIIDNLPEYMRYKSIITEEGTRIKAKENATSIANPITNNKIIIKPKATSYDKALSLARGLTAPCLHFDEPEFTDWIDIIVQNSASTYDTAAENAKANGGMYFRCMTCTPGDLDTKAGMGAQKILDNTAKWTEKIYDYVYSPIGLEGEMEKFFAAKGADCNTIVYIEYSYKQIGKSEDWLRRVSAKINDRLTVRREILLQRLHGSSASPYPQEDIEFICESEAKPIDELWVNDYYCFTIYEELSKAIPYIIGIDCSTGTGKDNNAITILNPYTCRPVAEFESSYIGETEYEQLIIDLVSDYLPRACVVIERNSVGDGIIDHLLKSKISNRLYYDKTLDLVKEKMAENETIKSMLEKKAKRKSYYGVYTGPRSRKDMFSILARHVREHKEDFVTHNIIRDLSRLVVTGSGKIVAGEGEDEEGNAFHDDSIMSYLIALYVYYHGTNLEAFGITKYDPDADLNVGQNKTINDVDWNKMNSDVLDMMKKEKEKEKITREEDWERIMKQAVEKAQNQSYNLYKKNLVDNPIYENSNTVMYDYDTGGEIPLSFFKEINNM